MGTGIWGRLADPHALPIVLIGLPTPSLPPIKLDPAFIVGLRKFSRFLYMILWSVLPLNFRAKPFCSQRDLQQSYCPIEETVRDHNAPADPLLVR
jgi:hypothetical protein